MAEQHQGEELKGRAKEAAGDLTGDEKLQSEGKTDQASASVKRTADKAKQKVNEMSQKLKGSSENNEAR